MMVTKKIEMKMKISRNFFLMLFFCVLVANLFTFTSTATATTAETQRFVVIYPPFLNVGFRPLVAGGNCAGTTSDYEIIIHAPNIMVYESPEGFFFNPNAPRTKLTTEGQKNIVVVESWMCTQVGGDLEKQMAFQAISDCYKTALLASSIGASLVITFMSSQAAEHIANGLGVWINKEVGCLISYSPPK
ncbi:MAG: hypothetical protein HQK49_18180 [Oligoflexia bacterium]|nr:hypothetical protein [Oligoflexia bacterium]